MVPRAEAICISEVFLLNYLTTEPLNVSNPANITSKNIFSLLIFDNALLIS